MDWSFSGNVQVNGNATLGGNAKVRGNVTVSRDVTVQGWLNAPNISTVYQGEYSSETALQAARPAPSAGWTASVVNADGGLDAYMVKDGAWVKRGVATGLEERVVRLKQSLDLTDNSVAELDANLSVHLSTWDSVKKNLTETIYPQVWANRDNIASHTSAISTLQSSQQTLSGQLSALSATLNSHLETWEAVKDNLINYEYPAIEELKQRVAALEAKVGNG